MNHSVSTFCINSIQTKRNLTKEEILIVLDGKNLIITGDNGCGKTKLVEGIYSILKTIIIDTGNNSIENLEIVNETNLEQFKKVRAGDTLYNYHKNRYIESKNKLESLNSIRLDIENVNEFKHSFHERNSFIKFFEARRSYETQDDNSISSINSFIEEYNKSPAENNEIKTQTYFERYVVSLLNYGMLNEARGNKEESLRIMSWFNKVVEDLQRLFEDPSLRIDFDIENLSLSIKQDKKDSYTLSQLSSGYSSILAIYAELLMCVELNKLPRQNLQGVILIDEIDAHLHVSLQKVIFSFFKNSFPNMQFIITTHSPFVVQSVNDAVIYDLSKLEQLDDLSMYSYEAITKGLLGEASDSDLLEQSLTELEKILSSENINKANLELNLNKMRPHSEKMHPRARAFFNVGLNKLLELDQEDM